MAKIAFYAENLAERGTAVALFDYARFSRDLLGHECLVLYDEVCPANNADVISRFQSEFELIACRNFSEADLNIASESCDLLYLIKSGEKNGMISSVVPTMVHCVFPNSVRQVHGASYAFVSEWLSRICARNLLPTVPHIVSIGKTNGNMRQDLGVPAEAMVFGCYGGRDSFDIEFVKNDVIPRVLDISSSVWFLFMNIEPFIEHPRVIFIQGSVDIEIKTAFINSCDAMLHARSRGETFGLAVGEFSLRDKPVLTYGGSRERAHLCALGTSALVYRKPEDLFDLIINFDSSAPSARKTYETLFSPETVMEQFAEGLIRPAQGSNFNAARSRLGVHRWNPFLMARPTLNKKLSRFF